MQTGTAYMEQYNYKDSNMHRKNSGCSKKTPLKVVEDDQALVLWDFQIQTETDGIQSSVHPAVQMNSILQQDNIWDFCTEEYNSRNSQDINIKH